MSRRKHRQPDLSEIDQILNMTDEECLEEGIREYGTEEEFHKAMGALRDKIIRMMDEIVEKMRDA